MPVNTILLSIAAGLISAIVFVSATTGDMILRVVLFLLTPFSLYLAGLGFGPTAAVIAAATATLIILGLSNPLTAFVFAASSALPAVATTYLALLARGEGDAREWYPVGRIVMVAALFGGGLAAFVMASLGSDLEALTKTLRGVVEVFAKTEMPAMRGAPEITPKLIDDMTASVLQTLPWALGVLATITILLNLWLAGRVTLASGRLPRPWPDISALALPRSAMLALAVALALSFAGGVAGLAVRGLAGAFTFCFAAAGLALLHSLTRNSTWRMFILIAIYSALIAVTVPATIVLAIAGLIETVFHYRALPSEPPENRNL